jgi:hypothetical protein
VGAANQPTGGYGSGWGSQWGTFQQWADSGGTSGLVACCACGGGVVSVPDAAADALAAQLVANRSVDWGYLQTAPGVEYSAQLANTTIDTLEITVCAWYCESVSDPSALCATDFAGDVHACTHRSL